MLTSGPLGRLTVSQILGLVPISASLGEEKREEEEEEEEEIDTPYTTIVGEDAVNAPASPSMENAYANEEQSSKTPSIENTDYSASSFDTTTTLARRAAVREQRRFARPNDAPRPSSFQSNDSRHFTVRDIVRPQPIAAYTASRTYILDDDDEVDRVSPLSMSALDVYLCTLQQQQQYSAIYPPSPPPSVYYSSSISSTASSRTIECPTCLAESRPRSGYFGTGGIYGDGVNGTEESRADEGFEKVDSAYADTWDAGWQWSKCGAWWWGCWGRGR